MEELKLYMLLLGCKPNGRHTEQHDIFFTVGTSLKSIIPDMLAFWPEANGILHIDSWREISHVNNFEIKIIPKREAQTVMKNKLFFLNLGGYKLNEFEEYHYKILTVNEDKSLAILQAKETVFYRHTNSPHIDDKYGVDVDDIYDVEEILPKQIKEKYSLQISPAISIEEDELHIGYLKLSKL